MIGTIINILIFVSFGMILENLPYMVNENQTILTTIIKPKISTILSPILGFIFTIGLYIISKNLHRDMSAGYCIGESVMMILQVETAMSSHCMQLMIFQIRKDLDRSSVSTIKLIVGIFHLIMSEAGFQTSLIETFVMSD